MERPMDESPKANVSGRNISELLVDEEGRRLFIEAVATVVHRDVFGRTHDTYNVDQLANLAAGIASSQYVGRHMVNAQRVGNAFGLLKLAVERATIDGLILEFGVYSGNTINYISGLVPNKTVYGFDSFQGLPETWRPGFPKGAFLTPTIPEVRDNVELVVGWFDRTLPNFLDSKPAKNVSLVHVDCDLYSSTQVIFGQLKGRIVPGTIIVFDEYYNYPGWEAHEFRAFQEFVEANRVRYDYIGLVPGHQQVAVRIIG
jgi:hypothetical protein